MKRCCYFVLLLLVAAPFTLAKAQWTPAGKIPGSARDGGIAFALGDKLYFGGGVDRTFLEYDPSANKWTKKAQIPGVATARAFAATFVLDGKGYVCGGVDGSVVLNDLWQYDPAADLWTRKHDLPGKPRAAAIGFAVEGDGYVGGGLDTTNAFLDFYVYDPAADDWSLTGNIPETGIVFPASFVVGGYGYVGTFATYGTGKETESNHVWRYDPFSNQWTRVADFPGSSRQAATGFALDGKGYIGFGQTVYTTARSDVFSYDPANDTWSPLTYPTAPSARAWSSAVTLQDKVYLGWGWDLVGNFDNDLWVLPSSHASVGEATRGAALAIYPNPATDVLHVEAQPSENVSVMNAVGETVLRSHLVDGALSVQTLEPGAYYLVVESAAGRKVERFIKR